MIIIVKSTEVPQCLRARGVERKDVCCADYDAYPDDYLCGKRKFDTFDRSIYGARAVKTALLKSHNNKCCYCEKKYLAPANLAVEHYRPKSGVRQGRGQRELYPGYYWLAYDWDNLLLSCHECNSSYKQIIFPLANPEGRARSHHDDLSREHPLLINPAAQDPREHIRFKGAVPRPVTVNGRITIRVIGLRRKSLREDRMEKLGELERLREIVDLAQDYSSDLRWKVLARGARKVLRKAVKPRAEYSSMAQDLLRS